MTPTTMSSFSRISSLQRAGTLALLLIAGATPALAQPTQAQRDAVKAACRSDFIANCSGVQPGGMAALQCLQKHNDKISSACQKAIAALKQ